MIPTTPSGTRTLRMRRPFGRVHSARVSPMGSSSAATSRTPCAISLIRGASQQQAVAHGAFEAGSFPHLRGSPRESFAHELQAHLRSPAATRSSRSVESSASCAAAARARSSFSCVEAELATVAVISCVLACPILPRRKIRSYFALHAQRDPLGMPAIHDGHMNSAFACQLGGAQFGNHASASQRALAVALRFKRRSQFAHHALQPGFLASVGNQQAIDIGQQQQPVGFYGGGEQRTQFVVVAESAFQFADADAVILIDDRHHAEREQFGERILQVAVAHRRGEVVARKQQLRDHFLAEK